MPRAFPLPMTIEKMLVGQVMTRELVTLGLNEKLVVADGVMKFGRFRHLPVIDEEGKLAGIVSQRDLFHGGLMRALGYGSHARDRVLDLMVVKEAMKSEVPTTTPATPLAAAARTMLDRQLDCLVVLDGEQLVGILTESDFVKLALDA